MDIFTVASLVILLNVSLLPESVESWTPVIIRILKDGIARSDLPRVLQEKHKKTLGKRTLRLKKADVIPLFTRPPQVEPARSSKQNSLTENSTRLDRLVDVASGQEVTCVDLVIHFHNKDGFRERTDHF